MIFFRSTHPMHSCQRSFIRSFPHNTIYYFSWQFAPFFAQNTSRNGRQHSARRFSNFLYVEGQTF